MSFNIAIAGHGGPTYEGQGEMVSQNHDIDFFQAESPTLTMNVQLCLLMCNIRQGNIWYNISIIFNNDKYLNDS